MLADLGADVVKVERPGAGDDTRAWGPPCLKDEDGRDTAEAAYFLCANRNKRSVTIDIARPEGQALVRKLAAQADVLLENFKVGGLKQYGLDYESLKALNPRLDLLLDHRLRPDRPLRAARRLRLPDPGHGRADEHHRPPRRRRRAPGRRRSASRLTDIMTGLYADHRDPGGACRPRAHGPRAAHRPGAARRAGRMPGQPGLELPGRRRARRAAWAMRIRTSCPTRTSRTADGDHDPGGRQRRPVREVLRRVAGTPEWAADERFATNPQRVRQPRRADPADRQARPRTRTTAASGSRALEEAGVPCGPINTIDEVFADPQVQARGHAHRDAAPGRRQRAAGGQSRFACRSHRSTIAAAPPLLGEHTDEVLREWLGITKNEAELVPGEQMPVPDRAS